MPSIDAKNASCIVDACFCCYEGLDFNPATCMGCAMEGRCLCMTESCCFKSPCKPYTTCTLCHWCCFCYECECMKFDDMTCCQFEEQCFCYIAACAFPTTKDVPMMCTLCPFMVIMPKFVCCGNPLKDSASVTPTGGPEEEGAVGAPPEAIEMER